MNGRDGKSGRFGPGNKFGRGNPHARRQAALHAVLFEAVDEQRLRKVAAKLADLVEGGDLEAVKLLFAYLLGKPGPAPDPDRLDLEERKILDAEPTRFEVYRALIDNMAAGVACARLKESQGDEGRVNLRDFASEILYAREIGGYRGRCDEACVYPTSVEIGAPFDNTMGRSPWS